MTMWQQMLVDCLEPEPADRVLGVCLAGQAPSLNLGWVRASAPRFECVEFNDKLIPLRHLAESFDKALVTDCLGCSVDDHALLRELNRVLVPGGVIVLSTPDGNDGSIAAASATRVAAIAQALATAGFDIADQRTVAEHHLIRAIKVRRCSYHPMT